MGRTLGLNKKTGRAMKMMGGGAIKHLSAGSYQFSEPAAKPRYKKRKRGSR